MDMVSDFSPVYSCDVTNSKRNAADICQMASPTAEQAILYTKLSRLTIGKIFFLAVTFVKVLGNP